jgi:hypothetical protein
MTMSEIFTLTNLWVMLIVISPIGAFQNHRTSATLYYGLLIANKQDLEFSSRGLQDSLTDPKYNWLFFLIQGVRAILIVALFYYGGITHGISSVIVVFLIAYSLTKKIFPPPDSRFWLRGILKSLINREADYRRKNDHMRADAIAEIRQRLVDLTQIN